MDDKIALRVGEPKQVWTSPKLRGNDVSAHESKPPRPMVQHSRDDLVRAWTPWAILTVFVLIWGLPQLQAFLNCLFAPEFPIQGLHNLIIRVPPVVPTPPPESAVYTSNLLSATGTGILLAAVIGALVMKYKPVSIVKTFFRTAQGLADLARAGREDDTLAGRIRHKFRMKNTTGYSLNALLDYATRWTSWPT